MGSIHDNAEHMSPQEMEQLLRKTKYGHLGMAFENEAYVVPVSHTYQGGRVWFQIAKEGKKTTYLQANPQACFQVDEWADCGWASVICYGTVTLSDDLDSKRQFVKLVSSREAPDEQLLNTSVYVCTLKIDEMTGRKCQGYAH